MLDTLESLIARLRSQAYDPFAVLIELLLIGLCVNWCASVLQGTRGTRALRGILIVLVVATLVVRVLAVQMGWVRLDLLYRYVLYGLAFIALVVFQPELRRAVIRAGDVRIAKRGTPHSNVVAALVKAAGALSKNHWGALLAIQRSVDLRGWAGNGTLLNAEISANLLTSIFYPNSTLHDLGVIIKGTRVVAANCQFPTAESDEIDASLGSRHLAAIGMSYETDALVLVVSEETGVISLADNGVLTRYLTLDDLAKELTTRLSGVPAAGDDRARGRRGPRLGRVLRRVAVVAPLALAIWYLADQATLADLKIPRLSIRVKHADPTRIVDVLSPSPPVFSVTLRGATRAIDRLRVEAPEQLNVDWVISATPPPGVSTWEAREVVENLSEIRQRGLSVVGISPSDIRLRLDEIASVPMRIEAAHGPVRIADARFEPAEANVTLRAQDLERLPEAQRVVVVPLESRLGGTPPDQPLRLEHVPLPDKVGGFNVIFMNPKEVNVALRVVGQRVTRHFAGVVVRVMAGPDILGAYTIERQDAMEWLIEVDVEGDRTVLDALQPKDITAFVPVTTDLVQAIPDPKFRAVDVVVQAPPGVTVTSPTRRVQLRLLPREDGGP
jgi:diadenylate cyclase